jgi:S-DNA-T family DNA segregation ATPase FtsK/SpoIIIE
MKAYDNFHPTIPDSVDLPEVETLPPFEAAQPATAKTAKKPDKKPKPKRVKAEAPPKEKIRKPVKPFTQIVKEWAGSQTTRWLLGLFLGFSGIYLGVCFLSYFSACVADQSEILNTAVGASENISNKGGEGGARMSQFLINDCFGLGSFVIVFWLVAMSLKQLVGKPRFKSVDFTIKSLVALITVSLIIGLLTIGLNSPVNWGGNHGRYVNEFIVKFFGWTGAVILCLFMIGSFVVICLRDFINWIIRIRRKRAEIKRIAAEKEAERLAREREIEEMRRFEEADAAKAGDNPEPETEEVVDTAQVTFNGEETGLYSTLPDFEEYTDSESMSGYVLTDEEAQDTQTVPPAGDKVQIPDLSAPHTDAPAAAADTAPSSMAAPDEADAEDETQEDDMVVNVNSIGEAKVTRKEAESLMPGMHPYKFPPAELLREGVSRISVDAAEQLENKEKIKKTLLDFGIPITSIEATVGPTVTLYEIVPDRGVKINRIRNLVDDIALSLSAVGVRIIAPIPGKGTVGIEVANNDPQTVSMRTVIKSHKYQESKYKLPIALGSTISNEVYIADLAKMPHLLVAGATGQGKSVGLNAIIASLLYRKSPDELKFVMIDPKMVEFSLYAKIEAHYLAKIPDAEDAIITDMDKVVATLSSLCVEMDNRYQLLKGAHTRNIEEYNDKIKARQLNPLEGHRFLPYIVVVVDEFSDLIMTAGKEVEIPIARLAQKARAVGMHVIIATQRPSTNVITGIIKANFPARIAFKVSSGVDSKTILDTPGAQQLIGRGDMLISNSAPMVRVQCAFIDTPEVEAICDYIERQPYGQGAYELPEPVVTGNDSNDSEMGNNFGDKDPLFDEVARLIVTSNTASTSSLQRRYSIGYNRAGKIMDQLEAAGIVGPAHGGKPRSVLVDAVTLESILKP